MSPSLNSYVHVLAALVAAQALAAGAGLAADPEIILRVNARHLGFEATKYIADIAEPQYVSVRAQEQLGQVIERHCDRLDNEFIKLLNSRRVDYPMLSGALTAESIFPADVKLKLPFCLKIPPGESPPRRPSPSLYTQAYQTDPPVFVYQKGYPWDTDSPMIIAGLPRGDGTIWSTGAAPVYEGWTKVPLKLGVDPQRAANRVQANLITAVPAHPDVPSAGVRSPVVAVGQNTIELLSALDAKEDLCPDVEASAGKYPFDTGALLHVLGLNQVRGERWSRPVLIVIADSGLSEIQVSQVFRHPAVADWQAKQQRLPVADYPHWQHGAFVASAALGGAHFLRFMDMMGFPIQIVPVNIIRDRNGHVKEEHLSKVIDEGRYESSIINLSITNNQKMVPLQKLLGDRRNALFVVAAGNSPEKVQSKHPAALGGDYENLIVVGSLDQNGDFSKRSSWSDVHVEIAASGCRVPVFEETGVDAGVRVALKSGTSVASPLVAFTAAMLRMYRIGGPYDLKKQILASADYAPELEGKVKHNLKLNVVRALALHNDVIEKRSGGGKQVIIGNITDGDRLLKLCGGLESKGRKLEHGGLRSLDLFDKEGVTHIFHMFEEESQTKLVGSKICKLDSELAEKELTIEELETSAPHKIKVRDIKKLLFAHPR
jgi:hypothetical protein